MLCKDMGEVEFDVCSYTMLFEAAGRADRPVHTQN